MLAVSAHFENRIGDRFAHFRCESFAEVCDRGQTRLPLHADARYVERSMPRHRSSAIHVSVWLLLAFAGGLWAAGQERGSSPANPNEEAFQALLKQGFELHQQARFAESIPVLERARKLEPQDYFANLLLGIDLLRTGKAEDAIPRLQLAAQVKPGEETPEDYLGEAQASLGHYAAAAEAYHRAMLRGHNSEEALQAWAGFALERFRQIGESLRASAVGVATVNRLQKAAAMPTHGLLCRQSIPVLERQFADHNQPADAQRLDTAFNLSICYALQAGTAAERLQANSSDEAALHRLRGDVLLRIKTDAAAAEEEYRQAIAHQPRDPGLLARLAEAQAGAGDTDGAKQSAQAALAIDPHRREALRTLAFLAMSNRDYEQALPFLRQIAAESPGDRGAQVEFGRALAQTGSSAEALQYLAPALEAGYPDEKGALHALEARVLRDLGRDEEAAKASAEARRLSDAFQARGKTSPGGKPNADQ
jgi:tetratricopeptide (TPR) repeat protein